MLNRRFVLSACAVAVVHAGVVRQYPVLRENPAEGGRETAYRRRSQSRIR